MKLSFGIRVKISKFKNNLDSSSIILRKFETFPSIDLVNRSNVLAGVVQTIGMNLNTAKVVVLSTGTKNIDAYSLTENKVPDTHAEVIARRSLMHYFYDELEKFLNSSNFNYCSQSKNNSSIAN